MIVSSKWRPQAAMVLGGGMGKRMLPLTKDIPKPLVRLKGRTLIDHVLDRIADAGIARAVVNVHYCADKLEAHVKQRKKPEILISDERQQLLETGGGVTKALPLLGQEPFLIHNSELGVDRGCRLQSRAVVFRLGSRHHGQPDAARIRGNEPRLRGIGRFRHGEGRAARAAR